MSAIDERVLERIRRDAGATNVGLLASDLRLKFATVDKAVARLIKAGRVERTEDNGLTTTIEEARQHAFDAEADRRFKSAVKSMPPRHHATKSSVDVVNGWGKPKQSRPFHYFKDSMSLCGKWSYFGPSTSGVPMQKRCVTCERKRPPGEW